MNKATGEHASSAAQKKPPAVANTAKISSYHDSNGDLHYPALETTHEHFQDKGIFHIWRCCRCTSRNVNDHRKCGGGGCGHRRCERDCRWLTMAGPGFAQKNASTAPKASSSREHAGGPRRSANDVMHLPSPPIETRKDVLLARGFIFEQVEYWICCLCGKDDNPMDEAACREGCGHIKGAHCVTHWLDR